MLWLFAGALLALNFHVWLKRQRAKPGEAVPGGLPFLAGALASFVVFVSIPLADKYLQVEVPWPWLWILLPFFLDVLGPGGWILRLLRLRRTDRH
jgi:hypothetical protein